MSMTRNDGKDEKKEPFLSDLGKPTLRGLRKCQKCGTWNGTRGFFCKNKTCDVIFKEAKSKSSVSKTPCKIITDDHNEKAVIYKKIDITPKIQENFTIFSVRLRPGGPDYRGFVHLVQNMITAASVRGVDKAVCYVENCPEIGKYFALKAAMPSDLCHHIKSISQYTSGTCLPIKASVVQNFLISESIKSELCKLMMCDQGPLVQRVSRNVMVVKCRKSSKCPLGYLHIQFIMAGKFSQPKFVCQCRDPDSEKNCVHLYAALLAFASDGKLTHEYRKHLEKFSGLNIDETSRRKDPINVSCQEKNFASPKTKISTYRNIAQKNNNNHENNSDKEKEESENNFRIITTSKPGNENEDRDVTNENRNVANENEVYETETSGVTDEIETCDVTGEIETCDVTDEIETCDVTDDNVELEVAMSNDDLDTLMQSLPRNSQFSDVSQNTLKKKDIVISKFSAALKRKKSAQNKTFSKSSSSPSAFDRYSRESRPNTYVNKTSSHFNFESTSAPSEESRLGINPREMFAPNLESSWDPNHSTLESSDENSALTSEFRWKPIESPNRKARKKQTLEETNVKFTFISWLKSAIERINQTQHYGFSSTPNPLVFHIPKLFFFCLLQRITLYGNKCKRGKVPHDEQLFFRNDSVPVGKFVKYTWYLTSLKQVQDVFFVRDMPILSSKYYSEEKNGGFISCGPPVKGKNAPRHKKTEFRTELCVGTSEFAQSSVVKSFVIEWIPDILPQSEIGELRIRFEFDQYMNGVLQNGKQAVLLPKSHMKILQKHPTLAPKPPVPKVPEFTTLALEAVEIDGENVKTYGETPLTPLTHTLQIEFC